MNWSQQILHRRRFLHGVVAGAGILAGCSTGGDSGGSATHGGISVTVAHHITNTELLRYDDDGNQCVASVASGKVRLSVVLDIDPGETGISPREIVTGVILRCDGDTYEQISMRSGFSDSAAGERLAVGFEVPEEIDPASCELELAWQGTGSRTETVHLGIGPEQESDLPDDRPSCAFAELRESFEIRVRNASGEDRVLHGVDAIAQAGSVEDRNGSFQFTITYTEEGAETIITRLREFGAINNPKDMTFLIVLDGDVLSTLGFSADLANSMASGDWLGDPQVLMMFEERETAERVRSVIVGQEEQG